MTLADFLFLAYLVVMGILIYWKGYYEGRRSAYDACIRELDRALGKIKPDADQG